MPHSKNPCESFEDFLLLHQSQLQNVGLPKPYWTTLFYKLNNKVFDAEEKFKMVKSENIQSNVFEENASDEGGLLSPQWSVLSRECMDIDEPHDIFLIKHAWSYNLDSARDNLENCSELVYRMATIMGLDVTDRYEDDIIEDVLQAMWSYNQSYTVGNNPEPCRNTNSVWYIMEELGTAIKHSDTPNMKCLPFLYIPSGQALTLLWPLKSINAGDEVTRNYLGKEIVNPLMRKLMMLPWKPDDMTHLSRKHIPADVHYFLESKDYTSLPNKYAEDPELPTDRNLRLFTDNQDLKNCFTDDRIELVDDPQSADILWVSNAFADYRQLSESRPGVLINHFPGENILSSPKLLAQVMRRAAALPHHIDTGGSLPDWFPETFDLECELSQFVSFFQNRASRDCNTTWLCEGQKNENSVLTNNLGSMLRLQSNEPQVAQQYITDPVLLDLPEEGSLKFDLTFAVMLHSLSPTTISTHQEFTVRMGNKPFNLRGFEDSKKHLSGKIIDSRQMQVSCEDFIDLFEEQYPEYGWSEVQKQIQQVLRDLFGTASTDEPPFGMIHSPQSRAVYTVSFVLSWAKNKEGKEKSYIQPMLTRVNINPELSLLEKNSHTQLYNDCLAALFLQDFSNVILL